MSIICFIWLVTIFDIVKNQATNSTNQVTNSTFEA